MARTSNIMKNSSAANETPQTKPIEVPEVRRNRGNSDLLAMIDKAILSVKNMVQAVKQAEPNIQKAALECVTHFEKHGDLGPSDRLVKGIIAVGHPTATQTARELIVWFKSNSPIQWERWGLGKCFKNKDETKGRIDTDLSSAAKVGFFETPQAVRAREAMDRAQKQSMKDANAKILVGRIMGQLKWFHNVLEGKDERTKAPTEAEAKKMKRIEKAVKSALVEVVGEDTILEKAAA